MTQTIDKSKILEMFDIGQHGPANALTTSEKLRIQYHIDAGINSGRAIRTMTAPVSHAISLTGSADFSSVVTALTKRYPDLDSLLKDIISNSNDGKLIAIYKIFAHEEIPISVIHPLACFDFNPNELSFKEDYEALKVKSYMMRFAILSVTDEQKADTA